MDETGSQEQVQSAGAKIAAVLFFYMLTPAAFAAALRLSCLGDFVIEAGNSYLRTKRRRLTAPHFSERRNSPRLSIERISDSGVGTGCGGRI